MRIQYDRHIQYFLKHLTLLPQPYESADTTRVVLVYFAIHGLALLKAINQIDKQQVIDWVYNLQLVGYGGFRGGNYHGGKFQRISTGEDTPPQFNYDSSSIAATYAAIAILKTLGDDLCRVDREGIIRMLKSLHNEQTGSFSCHNLGSEEDMRFVYCACAISEMLGDWRGVDKNAVLKFVRTSQSFDGAIGISPGLEGQGGATYCGIAALSLCKNLRHYGEKETDCLLRWLMHRQSKGFEGRCNKPPDSCYAFWNGATIALLGKLSFIDKESIQSFVLSCEFAHGGFSKFPGNYPDLLHSYYSLAWLSIAAGGTDPNLQPLDTKLQIPMCRTQVSAESDST